MASSFSKQVAEQLDNLTPAQQDMAKFILDHGERVAFMTAKQLAQSSGQSDAAVIRFSRALGYEGYPALREALRSGLLERAGASGMRQQHRSPSSIQELSQQVFATQATLVAETQQLNTDAQALAAADALIGAHRIWVTGHGTSYPLAAYLAMHLNQALDKAQLFNVEHGDLADRFRSVGAKDVFIGIGYVRYLPYTVDILRLAREAGATVIAITDRVSSPLARLAHHSLYAARDMTTTWWSQAGTLALADWLTMLVMARASDAVTEQLRRSDDEWKRLGHWQSTGNSQRDLSLEQHLKAGMKSGRKLSGGKR